MRALFFSAEGTRQEGERSRGRVERGRLAAPPSDGGNRKLARSGLRQCDCPVAMLARHPLSTMPPDLLPFLALALQDRKKQGRRLRMEFYIRRDEMTQRLGYRSVAHDSTCSDWMSQRGRR